MPDTPVDDAAAAVPAAADNAPAAGGLTRRERLDQLLTIEGRRIGLSELGDRIREGLYDEAVAEYSAQGTAPTWKAKGLGSVTLVTSDPVLPGEGEFVVSDRAAFHSWIAERFPADVTGTIYGIPSEVLPVVLELLDEYGAREMGGARPYLGSVLAVEGSRQQSLLADAGAADPDSAAGVFAGPSAGPHAGEELPGVTYAPGSPGSPGGVPKHIMVKLDKAAKEAAIAEALGDDAAAVLAAPIGELVTPDRALAMRQTAEAVAAIGGHDVEEGSEPVEDDAEHVAAVPAGEVAFVLPDGTPVVSAGAFTDPPAVVPPRVDTTTLPPVPEGGWATLRVPELQTACIAYGLAIGRKAQMVERLNNRTGASA